MLFLNTAKKTFGLLCVGFVMLAGLGIELWRNHTLFFPGLEKETPWPQDLFLKHTPSFEDDFFTTTYRKDLTKTALYKTTSYTVKGQKFKPKAIFEPYQEVGIASWYGPGFHGQKTANGEEFDMHAPSAAHKTLQLPCVIRVTNLENGRHVVVRVNDRGPFHGQGRNQRLVDLSYAAAKKLGFVHKGTAKVRLEVLPAPSLALAAACVGKPLGDFKKSYGTQAYAAH